MDAYADSDIHAYERSQMAMVRYARWAMMAITGWWTLVAAGTVIGFAAAGLSEGNELQEQIAFSLGGVCTAVLVVLFGVLPAVVGIVGLGQGARWGWMGTIAVGALNIVPCCTCLPVGGFLLYAMLNEEVRLAYQDA